MLEKWLLKRRFQKAISIALDLRDINSRLVRQKLNLYRSLKTEPDTVKKILEVTEKQQNNFLAIKEDLFDYDYPAADYNDVSELLGSINKGRTLLDRLIKILFSQEATLKGHIFDDLAFRKSFKDELKVYGDYNRLAQEFASYINKKNFTSIIISVAIGGTITTLIMRNIHFENPTGIEKTLIQLLGIPAAGIAYLAKKYLEELVERLLDSKARSVI